MKTLRLALALWAILLIAGCSAFDLGKLHTEGSEAGALCVTGNGPPLTGAGHIARAHTNKDFHGTLVISPECGIAIEAR